MFISVKAKQGRVAYTAARGGERIPEDRFILTEDTPWIRRLHDYHGDIFVEVERARTPVAPKPETSKSAPAA